MTESEPTSIMFAQMPAPDLDEHHYYEAVSPYPSGEYISVAINPAYGVPRKVFCAGKWWVWLPNGLPSGSVCHWTENPEYALIVKLG